MFNKKILLSLVVFGLCCSVPCSADSWSTGTTGQITTTATGTKVGIGMTTGTVPEKLYVAGGNILLDKNQYLKWKDNSGNIQNVLQFQSQSTGNGFIYLGFSQLTSLNLNGSNIWLNGGNISLVSTNNGFINISSGSGVNLGTSAKIVPASFTKAGDQAVMTFGDANQYIKSVWGGGIRIGTFGASDGLVLMEQSGCVGIGAIPSTTSTYKLIVEGKIGAREIVVTTAAWADHVFSSDYNLKPLNEVEKFIKTNKHLEGIPTEKEVKATGIPIGEMQT